jgi:hypothetical protein
MSDDADPWDPDWEPPRSKPAGRAGQRSTAGVPRSGYPDSPALPRVSSVDPGGRAARPRGGGTFSALLTMSSLLPVLSAFVVVVGLGLRRDLSPTLATSGAAVLVLVPIIALAGSLGFRRGMTGFAGWFWAIVLLFGVTLYFPGERPAALGEGSAWLALPLAGDRAAGFGEQIEELAASLEPVVDPGDPVSTLIDAPSAPSERAVELPAPTPRPAQPDDDDTIILPVSGSGTSLKVELGMDGRSGRTKLAVLFDTGATFTTLDRAALVELGVVIPPDAPTASFQTANGRMDAPLILLPRVYLGDTVIEHVTIAVCEACAQNGTAGLLGLNVTGQFQVTVNNEFGEVLLEPRADSGNRQLDVTHWLDIAGVANRWPTGRVEVEVTATNRSNVAVDEAVVEVECSDRSFAVQLDDLGAGASRTSRVELPRRTGCDEYRLILRSARWR